MGRRTGWVTALREAAARTVVGRVAAVAAALCVASAGLPGTVAEAAGAADVPSYAFDRNARGITAANGTTDAVRLEPGTTYRSSLAGREKVYYRLELDDASNAYVSVTAVPRAGTALASGDGVRVSVQNADSGSCSYDTVTVGASGEAHPITAWGAREILAGKGLCQEAGTYFLVVERTETGTEDGQPWELELAPVSEPPSARAGATSVPEAWNSATPAPLVEEPVDRPGGGGFSDATAVRQGVWRDEIVPGQTLFYKVPVDWGQQLYAAVDLDSAGTNAGFVVPALDLTAYNPVRAEIAGTSIGYGGTQKSASLPLLPPVRHVNRYAPTDPTQSLRFAGFHYLAVYLSAHVAERFGDGPYGVKLRVRIGGTAQAGPAYEGRPVPSGVFDTGTRGGPSASVGGTAGGGDGAADDGAMTAVAVGGLGTGSALLLVLGVWTVTARRRASAQIRASAQNPTA
ncbi:hypothetical protein BM536_027920 [Streptomyces phaeoluteigriseus]|uniref:Uncharacterized protein n=1 Tax=Streptomyces phaeoluteigriseus TaxID=114686 RepID=A0A1V6MLH2_9ACTN|nr:hypothetical protein [Streptomyces phaeoluteigriseus]OQD53330.1 hypothetical protein BM536_027920 [Streptomyces phaeoluteigriseus]